VVLRAHVLRGEQKEENEEGEGEEEAKRNMQRAASSNQYN